MNKKHLFKTSFYIFLILLIFQVFAINSLMTNIENMNSNHADSLKLSADHSSLYVDNIIRKQQREDLYSIRESWALYESNHDFSEIKNGIMDKDEVTRLLNLLLSSRKQFGPNGGFIAFNSKTGEILIDTTPIGRTGNIFLDSKDPLNKNVTETNIVVNSIFRGYDSTTSTTNATYMFNEPTKMGNESNNFRKFTLGEYNRLFVEKIILPYESLGFEASNEQITVLSLVNERDIVNGLESSVESFKDFMFTGNKISKNIYALAIVSIFIAMANVLNFLYVIQRVRYNQET